MKTYNITPKGDNSILYNNNDCIEIITFGMNSKNLEGRLKGIKSKDNCYFNTHIEFKDKIVVTTISKN